MRVRKCKNIVWLVLFFSAYTVKGQNDIVRDSLGIPETFTAAGKQYYTSSFHQWLWGKHYRKEWATPVTMPVVSLDTLEGGLYPYEAGGGSQTKSLRLRNKQGREYVLRSVYKNFSKAIPEVYKNTFIESIVNDQASVGHPYAALTIAPMAEAAKIYHTWPKIVYVPKQPALGEFNSSFGDQLYLLEQRPDENWEDAANFGHAKDIISTEKLLNELKESNNIEVDQPLFLKSRLFDMFIGDWARHEDQWRWARFEEDAQKIYRPVPRDRDQAYTKFDGVLLKVGLSAAGLGHIEGFGPTIKDIKSFNFPARYIDRRLLNELHLQQWVDVARELQHDLTDAVIEQAIQQLPVEVYPISGKQLAQSLRSRRDQLIDFAKEYYHFLAKEVEVTGTKEKEYFEINRLDDTETRINIYTVNDEGIRSSEPFYSRSFIAGETNEVRLYGLAGMDYYRINGNAKDGIKIRIIGGVDKDSIVDESTGSGRNIIVYENPGNFIQSSAKVYLSKDTCINSYQYDAVRYNKKGIAPIIFYSNADRIYAGLNYTVQKYKWRQESYASKHKFGIRYSLTQKAFNFLYGGEVNEFIGKWNLALNARYDFIKWTNFFGIGNESKQIINDIDFYRMRSQDGFASLGLNRNLGKHHNIGINGFFQTVKIINDPERLLAQHHEFSNKRLYERSNFGGVYAQYRFQYLDDIVVPRKGINFSATASYTQNLQESDRTVTNYEGYLNFYIPLVKNFVLAVRNGGATLSGKPEFYQLNAIGGTNTLRGFRRDRFWGETAFFNANELQWHFNVKSRLFNGKLAVLALFDNGRVWQSGEVSNIWHTAFGGGIMLAPFNKGMVTVSVAKSKERTMVHLGYGIALDRRD